MNAAVAEKRTMTRPGGSPKWRALSALMRTVGRTGTGINIGYRHGFDSGMMLDYVYRNRPSGKYVVGPIIDRFYLNAVGWRAIRERKELLKAVVVEQLCALAARSYPSTGEGRPVLADLAAGPGRYLVEAFRDLESVDGDLARRLTVICRDLSTEALEQGEALAAELRLTNFRYEWGDAVDPASLQTVAPLPDLVVVAGLYELFTDAALISRSMEGIYTILKPGGRLVFTTQVRHPQLDLIANVLVDRDGEPWVMVCRPVEEAEALATGAGFRVLESQMEPLGLFCVSVCEKPGGEGNGSAY